MACGTPESGTPATSTEPEAHHLLQKQAMDHSTKMAEYAARIVEQEKQKE